MSSGRFSFVDLHCHLDLFEDPAAAVAKADVAGVYTLCVTTAPRSWRGTTKLIAGRKRIRVALGLHPELAHARANELSMFEALLPETAYVGEVGLDGSPEHRQHQAIQERVFSTILDLATKAGGRVLSIHSRRAASAVLDCLEHRPEAGIPIMHWFTGSAAELRRAVQLGCYFSVSPGMLKSKSGIMLIKAIPQERLLTETDGPFGPQGKGGVAGPWDAPDLVEMIAKNINVHADDLADIIINNFRRIANSGMLFKLI